MLESNIELAKRFVSSKYWIWTSGMMRLRLTQPNMRDFLKREGRVSEYDEWPYGEWPVIPDIEDPATIGCILFLVRKLYNDSCVCIIPIDYGPAGVMWQCRLTAGGRQLTQRHFTTEVEALLAAMESIQ